MKSYKNPYMCPMNPLYICPFYDQAGEKEYDDFFERDDYEDLYVEDDYDEDYRESGEDDNERMKQRPQEVNRIMVLINRKFDNYYSELQQYGIQRADTRNIFRNTVSYVLRNAKKYTGTIAQRTEVILNDLRRDNPYAFTILRRHGVPNVRINQIMRDIISFVLGNIEGGQA